MNPQFHIVLYTTLFFDVFFVACIPLDLDLKLELLKIIACSVYHL